MVEKDITPKKGFKNRHTNPLPRKKCVIFIIVKNEIFLCKWIPVRIEDVANKGFLGVARTIYRKPEELDLEIGFNVFEKNNDEFIYYKEVKFPK